MVRSSQYWQAMGVYGLSFAAIGLTTPYLTQYLLGRGFSGADIGTTDAFASLLVLVFVPAMSSLADRTGRHRRMLLVVTLLCGFATLGIVGPWGLVLVAVAVVLSRALTSLGMVLRNRLSLYWLEQRQSVAYGSLRIGGSLGFAIVSLVGGLVAGLTGIEALIVFSAVGILASALLFGPYEKQLPVRDASESRREGALSPAMRAILVTTLLTALGGRAYLGWVYNYIQYDLDGGTAAVGAFASLIAVIEIPTMLYTDRLQRRWNPAILWSGGILLQALCWVAISLVGTAPQAIMLGALYGIANGVVLVSPIVLTGQVSKPSNAALNLALVGTISSLGAMIGSPIAGHLFDTIGVRPLMRLGAVVMILASANLALLYYRLQHRKVTVASRPT